MSPRRKKDPFAPIVHGHGIIRPNKFGTFNVEVNYKGQRPRITKKTESEARNWIDAQMLELSRQYVPLTESQLRDARAALDLLPAGVTLVDTARAWTQANARPSIKLQDAFDSYKKEREAAGRRALTLKDYDWKFAPLLAAEKETPIGNLTTARLADLLSVWQGVTRDNYRVAWRGLFRWAKSSGLIKEDPTEALARHRADERTPVAMTWKQAHRLLRAAEKQTPDIVPGLALAIFTGLRPYELFRLSWSSVSYHILIAAEATKVRQRRYVEIPPNLHQWLQAYPGKGKIISSQITWRRRMDDLRPVLGFEAWPVDLFRHTFATFHLARHQDAGRTAHQLGNSSDVVYRHYRALATSQQAKRFFSICPKPFIEERRAKRRRINDKNTSNTNASIIEST